MGHHPYNGDEIGIDLDFITDPLEDIGSSIIDRLGDVVRVIPGSEWVIQGVNTVTGPIGDFVEGPLRDFAKTAVGETIIRAFSVMVGYGLAVLPVVGYTLSFLTWSIPGLARGEEFDTAMVNEFSYRVDKVVQYFAGDVGKQANAELKQYYNDLMSEQLQNAIESIDVTAKSMGISPNQWLAQTGMTPKRLAAELGIREDVAAYGIEWFRGQSKAALEAIKNQYDIKTGAKFLTLGKASTSTGTRAPIDPCVALANAKRDGQSKAIIDALTKKCVESKTMGLADTITSALKSQTVNPLVSSQSSTLGKTGASGTSGKNPCQLYEAAKAQRLSAAVLSSLKTKCDAYSAEMAAKQSTLAASMAVNVMPSAMGPAADAADSSESNKKSAVAGIVSGFVGTGGALLAGLSAPVAIPVGLGFAAGGAIATKLLSRRKSTTG